MCLRLWGVLLALRVGQTGRALIGPSAPVVREQRSVVPAVLPDGCSLVTPGRLNAPQSLQVERALPILALKPPQPPQSLLRLPVNPLSFLRVQPLLRWYLGCPQTYAQPQTLTAQKSPPATDPQRVNGPAQKPCGGPQPPCDGQ